MSKSLNSICYHCGSSLLPNEAYSVDLNGVSRSFCCAGCMAIAQTIQPISDARGSSAFRTLMAQNLCEKYFTENFKI